jgi:cytosine deaminase
VVGESRTFSGGLDWLRAAGVRVFDLDSDECVHLMESFIREHPEIWHEDIGDDQSGG